MSDGGPAFPQALAVGPSGDVYSSHDSSFAGMSLRDWFAGQALPAFVEMYRGNTSPSELQQMAARSYALAEAMLAEREKQP